MSVRSDFFNALSDEALMTAYQGGNEQAFAELYRRHSSRLYGYLRAKLRDRAQVDDVFQAVFLKLHHSRRSYDASFPFAPWLYTVCRSVLLDHLRRTGRSLEDSVEQEILDHVASQVVSKTVDAATQELDGVSELPPEQRRALELRYQQELSFAQIASALETSPANARQLVSRAVRRLKTILVKGGSHAHK